MDLKNGLFCNACSGIAALNFAIITGANPIYCLGLDGTYLPKKNGSHYKEVYINEIKVENELSRQEIYEDKRHNLFRKFIPWKNRIINVCDPDISVMKDTFKTIKFEDINFDDIRKKTNPKKTKI